MDSAQLYLHTSNRLDQLAQSLVAISHEQPPSSPLESEQVMVQNAGIARWLRYEITAIEGVAMNWDFPFTARVISNIASAINPDFETTGSYDPDSARWHLFEQLDRIGDSKAFELVKNYIAGDEKKRLKFATRLAQLFDEYLVYRPDVILDWENGKGKPAWMREVWRRLSRSLYGKSVSPPHIARIWKESATRKSPIPSTNLLPSRLFVFGFSTLAPLQLDLLKVASQRIPIHIFLLQPTNLYWSDLRGNKQARAEQRKRKKASAVDLPHEVGNPLLPAWGKQSQEFLDALIDRDPIQFDHGFAESASDSQLHALQSDVFNLRDRSSQQNQQYDLFEEAPPPFPDFDHSIEIHACHSETRECEALHDFLLQAFHDIPDLLPGEILVMAPDIDRYRQAIETVFRSETDLKRQIPFSISDKRIGQESELYQGMIAFFGLPLARLSAEEMIDFFSLPLIRKRCGFSDRNLEAIESWIRSIGTTWGWSSSSRETQGAFPTKINTWKEFRERIALGLAMGSDNELWDDILPFPHLEGETALLAGRLLSLLNEIEIWIGETNHSKSVSDWHDSVLNRIAYFDSAFDEYDLIDYRQINDQIEKILPPQEPAVVSGLEICSLLGQELDREASRSSLFNGKVSFCSLKPMRNVPARIICVLGLNSDEFPRIRRRANFDIMNFDTRPCDRSPKDEDKQLFLEALLSAQDRLLLSYQKASLSSDDAREPSSTLQDLIDYLSAASEESSGPRFILPHKRLSYDPSYFDAASPLFTYSKGRARLCWLATSAREPIQTSDSKPAPFEPKRLDDILNLEQLIAFFKHPQKAFVRQTLEARFIDDADALLETDFLNLPPLPRYSLRDRARQWLLSDDDRFSKPDIIAAEKLLPPGFVSELQYQGLYDEAIALRERMDKQGIDQTINKLSGVVQIGDHCLDGMASITTAGAQILLEAGSLNANRHLESWIRHQFANHLKSGIHTQVHSIADPDKEIHYHADSFKENILSSLFSIMEDGLKRPIPFFPELSFQYAKILAKTGDDSPETREQAWHRIASRLSDASRYPSFGIPFWDQYVITCFRPGSIDREVFHEFSSSVFLPLLESLQEKLAGSE